MWPLGIPLQSLPGPSSSSGFDFGNTDFCSNAYMDLSVPLEFPQGSQASSRVETCKSGLLSSWKISQASCSVDIGIGGFLLRFHRALTPAFMSLVDAQGDCRVSAGESGVTGVHWDIRVFWNGGRSVEFLSSVKLRPPPLEVRREWGDSFPNEAGKWTLISR